MIIYIKMDLVLNNLQSLICHKTQPTNQLVLLFYVLLPELKHLTTFGFSVSHLWFISTVLFFN